MDIRAKIGSDALLVVIPDPVTCFSTAKYSQKQVFRMMSDSSLLIVDWITSGRHESGEKWDFKLYKSTNQIFLAGDEPLFLDTVVCIACTSLKTHLKSVGTHEKTWGQLELYRQRIRLYKNQSLDYRICKPLLKREKNKQEKVALHRNPNTLKASSTAFLILLDQTSITSIAERMQDYQVIAMVILLGPKLKHVQNQVKENVQKMMSEQLHISSTSFRGYKKARTDLCYAPPSFVASCSAFGPQGTGVVVRIAAMTTESVYRFLQHQLASLEPLLGVSPYH
ncbi:hypothetical protein RJ639_003350 [Escallonia herrerae]|uniref:Urease accessory protein n=1 Tax=Escallonia herrerae TaxID=1293975 RepID=A0AA88W6X6_9ASTE|nr:hypothetical protein RJ639_003350 [Escallonia herrerae]